MSQPRPQPRPIDFSLADFTHNDNPDVGHAPAEFLEWTAHEEIQWGMGFFEQVLGTSASPRITIIDRATGKPRQMINLTSYNYLGLNTHPEVIAAAMQGLKTFGLGASGSPRLSGLMAVHQELNEKLSAFKRKEDCVLFSGGVMGNIGAISAIMRKNDVLVIDELAHQSIVDGATLARCKLRTFTHNDANDLERVLKQGKDEGRRQLVAVEGVYSMDGDLANLPEITDVCERYGAGIYLDEAHSTLMFGKNGRGAAEHFDVEDKIAINYGTFSKSFGAVGGFVCASRDLILYMRCYATTYAFSCAPAPAIMAGLIKSLEVATRDSSLRDRLWENTAYFRGQLEKLGFNLGLTQSQVLPIILGVEREKLFRYTEALQKRGLFIQPVDYPAVPAHGTRFRVSMSAEYTRELMDEALNIIEDVLIRNKLD
ncbi:MAG: aminotransferase class I/II-fold pyridoxal phosphate-dependent enzyme [Planctomycetota bacterium]